MIVVSGSRSNSSISSNNNSRSSRLTSSSCELNIFKILRMSKIMSSFKGWSIRRLASRLQRSQLLRKVSGGLMLMV